MEQTGDTAVNVDFALKENSAPVALLVVDSNGREVYFKSSGKVSGLGFNAKDVGRDSIFWLSSMSKLITTLAVLQCVSRGQITLDQDVTPFLPELAAIQVLNQAGDDGKMTTRQRSRPITLRQLLSHQSGCGLSVLHPVLLQYAQENNLVPDIENPINFIDSSILDRVVVETLTKLPLCFEPGSGSFTYGSGFDWISRLVSVLNGQVFEDYVNEHICTPLGLKNTTMLFSEIPNDFEQRWVRPTRYEPDENTFGWVDSNAPGHGLASGSHGAYNTPADFGQLLSVLLNPSLASRIGINTACWKEIFAPQLINPTEKGPESLAGCMEGPMRHLFGVASLPTSTTFNFGLGAALTNLNIPGMRRQGTYGWHGIQNTFYWIDRKSGIAATVMANCFPAADPRLTELMQDFEKFVYGTLVPQLELNK